MLRATWLGDDGQAEASEVADVFVGVVCEDAAELGPVPDGAEPVRVEGKVAKVVEEDLPENVVVEARVRVDDCLAGLVDREELFGQWLKEAVFEVAVHESGDLRTLAQ